MLEVLQLSFDDLNQSYRNQIKKAPVAQSDGIDKSIPIPGNIAMPACPTTIPIAPPIVNNGAIVPPEVPLPKEIAQEIDSPVAFTAKILQILAKTEIVRSIKGVHGGFDIPQEMLKEIKLSHIVIAIDGEKVFTGCGLGLSKCSEEHPCPAHEKFKSIRVLLATMLETTTLEELAMGIKTGVTFLKY